MEGTALDSHITEKGRKTNVMLSIIKINFVNAYVVFYRRRLKER